MSNELVIAAKSNCSMENSVENSISNDQIVLDSNVNGTGNTNKGETSHINNAGDSNVCNGVAKIKKVCMCTHLFPITEIEANGKN